MGLLFYPRGGSAQVVRCLARALPAVGWDVSVACGSIGSPGEGSHAATFFAGLAVSVADFTPALAAFRQGEDAMAAPMPLHPSYEERPGARDRLFAALSPELAEHQAHAWEDVLVSAGFDGANLIQQAFSPPRPPSVEALTWCRSLIDPRASVRFPGTCRTQRWCVLGALTCVVLCGSGLSASVSFVATAATRWAMRCRRASWPAAAARSGPLARGGDRRAGRGGSNCAG